MSPTAMLPPVAAAFTANAPTSEATAAFIANRRSSGALLGMCTPSVIR